MLKLSVGEGVLRSGGKEDLLYTGGKGVGKGKGGQYACWIMEVGKVYYSICSIMIMMSTPLYQVYVLLFIGSLACDVYAVLYVYYVAYVICYILYKYIQYISRS